MVVVAILMGTYMYEESIYSSLITVQGYVLGKLTCLQLFLFFTATVMQCYHLQSLLVGKYHLLYHCGPVFFVSAVTARTLTHSFHWLNT